MMPSTHPSFKLWLKRKGMSIKDFSAWIKNSIEPSPFYPWEEDVYAGTVFDMVRMFSLLDHYPRDSRLLGKPSEGSTSCNQSKA